MQPTRESLRQHGRPILSALAFANDDHGMSEVNGLYSKLQSFIDSHLGTVQSLGEQAFTFEQVHLRTDTLGGTPLLDITTRGTHPCLMISH